MGDPVLVGEELFEFAPAGMTVLVPADEDMGGEGREARGDGPDVEVVDFDNAIGGCHLLAYFPGVQAAGRGFEQDVGRVPKELPRAAQDQEPDGYADQGVGIAPAGKDDGGCGGHRADRTKGIGEYVAQGSSMFRFSPLTCKGWQHRPR